MLLAVQLHSCIPVSLHYMDTGASMFAEVYVGADMCVDMCVNMCINMCLDMCLDMCIDECMDICAKIRVWTCV